MLKGAQLAPMNIIHQNTIEEFGRIVGKDRLTHDQSFVFKNGSGLSVNKRVRKEELAPCMFGATLRRMMKWGCAARRLYPSSPIFINKTDLQSAYRREHLNHLMSVQAMTQLSDENIALIALRLTFEGAPCPSEWGIISETITDLANAIIE
jgi:hypothetical protein